MLRHTRNSQTPANKKGRPFVGDRLEWLGWEDYLDYAKGLRAATVKNILPK